MDEHNSQRKSLRKNLRSDYKSMLDPFSEKYKVDKEKNDILASLGLRTKAGTKKKTKADNLQNSPLQDCLFPSYSKTRSFKNPKSSVIKVASKTPPLEKESATLITGAMTQKKSRLKGKGDSSDIDGGSEYLVSEIKELSPKDKGIKFKISGDVRQPFIKLKKCSIDELQLKNRIVKIKGLYEQLHENANLDKNDLSSGRHSYSPFIDRQVSSNNDQVKDSEHGKENPHNHFTEEKSSPQETNSETILNQRNCSALHNGEENSSGRYSINSLAERLKGSSQQDSSRKVTFEKSSYSEPPFVLNSELSPLKNEESIKHQKLPVLNRKKPTIKDNINKKMALSLLPTPMSKWKTQQQEQKQNYTKLPRKLWKSSQMKKRGRRRRKMDESCSTKIKKDEIKLTPQTTLTTTAQTTTAQTLTTTAQTLTTTAQTTLTTLTTTQTPTTAAEIPKKERKKSQRRTGRRFSVTGNWYIAAGFLNDVISLLEEFDSVDGWRFMDFAKCWCKKAFSLIYRGRQTFKELLEFSEEITLLTKRFLSPPHSVKRRIGALYTLYGLYHKFPLGRRHFFFLRFELEEYKMLLDLIHPFRSNTENPDPAFVFRKLELEGAILHCASACEPCYDFHNEEREFVELEYGKQRLAKSSAVSNAIPKIQLQADKEILLHYHSIKARVAGHKDTPEKGLSMITPEFLSGISSNLMQLRQNTLCELGMNADSSSSNKESAIDEDVNVKTGNWDRDRDLSPGVDAVEIMETVNKGTSGMRSRHVFEKNEMTKNRGICDFMRPPTAEDLHKPLRMQSKKGGIGRRGRPPKMKRKDAEEGISPCTESEPRDGRVLLSIESEPPVYQELREALLPQPMPPKKKRGRKRVAALLQAAIYPPPRGQKPKQPFSIVKTLTDDFTAGKDAMAAPAQFSATRLSASELPATKQDPTIIVKVRLRADAIRKMVKLKVQVSLEAFQAIRKNAARYANFKEKLKPLIKETQSGENRLKEWLVESVDLPGEAEESKEPQKKSPAPSPLKKKLSLKEKYECLKHNDDDDDSEDNDDPQDDDVPRKTSWRTEEEKDTDYSPPKEDPEEDILEYEDGDLEEEDDDWVVDEYDRYWWRRKKGRRRGWDGYWEERGPRDSDQLLQLRTEKSLAMVPIQVAGTLRYFPMVKTKEQEQPVSDLEDTLYTWNDFSSEKEPPFKKRSRSINEAFPYLVTPRRPKSSYTSGDKDHSRFLTPPKSKRVKMDLPDLPSQGNSREEYENSSDVSIKKEAQTVLEELADDWEEDSFSGAPTAELPAECTFEGDEDNVPVVAGALLNRDHEAEEASWNSINLVDVTDPEDETGLTAVRKELDPLILHSPEVSSTLPKVSEILPNLSVPASITCGSNIQVIPVQVDKSLSTTETRKPLDLSSGPPSDIQMSNMDDVFPSQLLTVDINNKDNPLYYKMTASDGNDIFVPVSSLPEIGPQNFEILSFNVADVKHFSPSSGSPPDGQSPFKTLHTKTLPIPPPVSSPHIPQSTSSSPSTSSNLPLLSRDSLEGSRPSCTFLFSPKSSPMLKYLPAAVGKASGKPPSAENKVKFLFKGFLKSQK